MEIDELAEHLNSLKRDECYRVDAVLKESPHEITQKVFFVGANGAEQGPYIRKYIKREAGMGSAYRRIFEAQRDGRRFRYIPRILDCYDADDTLAVVLEYVRGETLAEVVYRCDPSLPLAKDVFCRLCDAVTELHEGFDPPIIHRDLKPGNVILSRDSLTVIDFGIARAWREGAGEDTVRFGTRAYAPPEQFGYRQTDVRSDVYALGMLLYFCLVEKTPDAHTHEKGFRDPRIPESVCEVLLRATAFDPDDRYASARELKAAFRAALSQTEVRRDGGARGKETPAMPGTPAMRDVSLSHHTSASPEPFKAPEASEPLRGSAGSTPRQPIAEPAHEGAASNSPGILARLKSTRRPSELVPAWLGILWDIFIVLLLAVLGITGFDQVVLHPSNEGATYPAWYNAFMYAGIMVMFIGASLALFDKRLIARRFSAVRRVQGLKGAAIGVFLALASFIVVLAVGVVALSVQQML